MSTLYTIPTDPDAPFYSQFTALSGVDYKLTFVYCQRENCWYLTIGTEAAIDIVRGIKLVTNWPLLLGHQDERLPPGVLMVLSNTTEDALPGLGELGKGRRCELVYQDG